MKRVIKKVAVLGSGVMGSRIACHFAGIGVQVLLLDIVSPSATANSNPAERNKLVNDALAAVIKSNPSPLYTKDAAKNITTGNFEDNLSEIASVDWIVEVVVERLDVKQQVYEQVEKHRKHGTLITSNTSGIPIHLLCEGRSNDFKENFCGAHFFNPPRYLKLLEIIPSSYTNPAIIDFLLHYGDLFLGKTTVLCKDTPAFIANRVGVFSIMSTMNGMEQLGLSIDEVDALTGPIIGRPKSATFRTADVVGIDTLVKVAVGVSDNCPNDEAIAAFSIPHWVQSLLDNKWLGDKTGSGFFKKLPANAQGEKEIEVLDLVTMTYQKRKKVAFATLSAAKAIEDLPTRLKAVYAGTDKAWAFYQYFFHQLFAYISHRIPEISDELYRIDDAMKAGFGWEIGAFESWDTLGVSKTVAQMKATGVKVADWVDAMLAKGINHFYKIENGKRYYYDSITQAFKEIPGGDTFLILKNNADKIVWKNNVCTLYDMGEEVVGLQWNTKMNTIGGDVLEGIQQSIQLAEANYKGLVIANDGENFSAGANLGLIFLYAVEQDFDELDFAIRQFQQTMMRVRYSAIPVITAPHGLSLGGGCEINLHADKICAAAETYIGLVELGVGLIPGGGGTKEFALRAADELHAEEPETITLKKRFFDIATAKVSTSAHEAFDMGIFRKGKDAIIINTQRRIKAAKDSAIALYDLGYQMPMERKDIKVLGRTGLGAMLAGINGMKQAGYATEHDTLVAKKLAYVLCGGDLSEQSLVSEQYLLDLEREAFLSLCGERKTLERIEAVLKTGKPIRN